MTGIEIYKYLPKTNCKKCGFPTCLAFAMKVAQKQAEISLCPELSPESRQFLEEASRPPIKLVSIGRDKKIETGNETVLFRHEKTFYHQPGLVIRIKDTESPGDAARRIREVSSYSVQRVGLDLTLDGFALDNESGNPASFLRLVETAVNNTDMPLVLMSPDTATMKLALDKTAQNRPLIYSATRDNWQDMAQLALDYHCPLAVSERESPGNLAELTERVIQMGVEDIITDPGADSFGNSVDLLTQLRRLAINKRCRPLGYPSITFPGDHASGPEDEALLAAQQIAKYAGIIVLDHFYPGIVYPLLTLRLNIYTDPQKPVKVAAGIYPINDPGNSDPLLVTTDFSLTYFSVAGEIQSCGFPSWLLICDTGGLSVLTAWAAGKFNAREIAKTAKQFGVNDYVNHNALVIPGYVAVIKGALEEEMAGWKILVGPREAMDIGNYLKRTWRENVL
ncbi:MAG: acetyl-CoA decarbonylase/synthase complex subunit gamma [Dehalococcoidia bacterium]|nr:acetyl-CoA decarbonylase/synthase complex subunit gamma [Dehalococcoidia bacterium]